MIQAVGISVSKHLSRLSGLALLWAAIGTPAAVGQFGLPKIPKVPRIPGQKEEKAPKDVAKKAVTLPAPQLTGINPASAPPGGSGNLALTGSNFTAGMGIKISCRGGAQPQVGGFKVQDPGSATVHVIVPFNAVEGPCALSLSRKMGKTGPVDINESEAGTVEVFQVPDSGPKFAISDTGALPVSVPVILLAEGEQDFMSLMPKLGQAMQPGFGQQGEKTSLLLSGDSVKFMQGQTSVFSEPVSAVKAVDEMSAMGQSMGIFRIEFKNGKIYNFIGAPNSESHMDAKKVAAFVKKRLGK